MKEQFEQFRVVVEEALKSKAEELYYLGYEEVTTNDVWECLLATTWKRIKEMPRLYQIVEDILSLSSGTYVLYLTKKVNNESDLFFKE